MVTRKPVPLRPQRRVSLPAVAARLVINSGSPLRSTHHEVSDELSDNHHVRGRTLPDSRGCVYRSTPQQAAGHRSAWIASHRRAHSKRRHSNASGGPRSGIVPGLGARAVGNQINEGIPSHRRRRCSGPGAGVEVVQPPGAPPRPLHLARFRTSPPTRRDTRFEPTCRMSRTTTSCCQHRQRWSPTTRRLRPGTGRRPSPGTVTDCETPDLESDVWHGQITGQRPQPKSLPIYISWYINSDGRPWTSSDVNPKIRPVHGTNSR